MIRVIIMTCCFCFHIFSQSDDSLEFLNNEIGDIIITDEEQDNSELMDYFENLAAEPININKAGTDEFLTIPFLSVSDAEYIINFREKHGKFFSIYELYMIKEIPERQIKKLMPFIIVDDPADDLRNKLKIKFIDRFRNSNLKKYDDLTGWSNYNTFRLANDRISAGITTEKDQGETNFTDFYSGYIQLKDFFSFKSVVIGDYYFSQGQGLIFNRPGQFVKSPLSTSIYKNSGKGIIPKTGKAENVFFRGAAFEKAFGSFALSGFFSARFYDASVDSSGSITRFINDGFHRSSLENQRRNKTYITTAGSSISFNNSPLCVGVNYYYSLLNRNFRGFKSMEGISLASSYFNRKIYIFSEIGYNPEINSHAFLSGFHLYPVGIIEFITIYRNYSPEYINMYGSGFGENNTTKNEEGIYSGLKLKIPSFEISLNLDQYKFPFANESNSTGGYDIYFDSEILLPGRSSITLRYKQTVHEELINSDLLKIIREKVRHTLRTDFKFNYGNTQWKIRIEYINSNIRDFFNDKGIIFMQNLKINFSDWILFTGSFSYFRTDSFNSAVYSFDSGFPGILESNSLWGEGIYMYTVFRLSLKKYLKFYIKYSETLKMIPLKSSAESFIIQTELNL